jgi:hypothetical protein
MSVAAEPLLQSLLDSERGLYEAIKAVRDAVAAGIETSDAKGACRATPRHRAST